MDPVIVTEGVSKRFGESWAVRELTLTVERGQVFGFLGPNGAGKTTTVRLLNGILEANQGSAAVLGMDPNTHGAEIRRHSGVLTENPSLYEALSARENLRFSGEVYGVPTDELPGRIDALLDRFGLLDRADDKVGVYSRGMKQRLAMARALLHEPEIVFLDEPSAGLDPAAARDMLELVGELSHRHGRTIFMCTHNLVEAERLCDVVGVIDRGRLRALGSPADLARQLWHTTLIEVDLHGAPDGTRTTGDSECARRGGAGRAMEISPWSRCPTPRCRRRLYRPSLGPAGGSMACITGATTLRMCTLPSSAATRPLKRIRRTSPMRNWNWRGMRAVVVKDLTQVRQNTMVWLPMVILPVILQVILPVFMIMLSRAWREKQR